MIVRLCRVFCWEHTPGARGRTPVRHDCTSMSRLLLGARARRQLALHVYMCINEHFPRCCLYCTPLYPTPSPMLHPGEMARTCVQTKPVYIHVVYMNTHFWPMCAFAACMWLREDRFPVRRGARPHVRSHEHELLGGLVWEHEGRARAPSATHIAF
jgi:hypothetical protein